MNTNRYAVLRKSVMLALLGSFALGLSACHTVDGMGKDVEDLGQKVQEEADDAGHDD